MTIRQNNSVNYIIGGEYILIESRILTIFSDRLLIIFNDVSIEIIFGVIKGADFSMSIKQEADRRRYTIHIINFNKAGLQGFFEPMPLGIIDNKKHYFTLSGLAVTGSKYNVTVVNILRKLSDG